MSLQSGVSQMMDNKLVSGLSMKYKSELRNYTLILEELSIIEDLSICILKIQGQSSMPTLIYKYLN